MMRTLSIQPVQGALLAMLALLMLSSTGCELRKRMYDQPKYEAYEVSDFFGDRMSSRMPIEGTIARGQLSENEGDQTGMIDGAFAEDVPYDITKEFLERGQSRFNIYCSACHGRTGIGNGVVVQRGYKQPPSIHEQRLRDIQPGYIYNVITKGFGVMPSYAQQLNPDDRWAVVAYLRALQFSQNATLEDASEEGRQKLLAEQE